MSKRHKAMQTQGRHTPSAAKIASDTSSTYGGVSGLSSSATSAGLADNRNLEITAAPPVSGSDSRNTPLTLGHLQMGWKVLLAAFTLISVVATGTWWVSHMSSRVDQHEEDIKEVKGKTEKLLNDSALSSAKLQNLDSQVGKLEDKMLGEALARSKK